MSRLIMFTAAYPYDRTNAWKGQELAIFRDYFKQIYVAPLGQKEREIAPNLPDGVTVLPPIFPLEAKHRPTICRMARLLSMRLPVHAQLFEPVPNLASARRYWAAAADIEEIMRSSAWNDHVAPILPDSTLYFFWGRGYAALLPHLPDAARARSLVRFHRWDLYPEINQGYIPLQRRIVEAAGLLAPISKDGVDLIVGLYPEHASRTRCLRLGTELRDLSRPSDDGRVRIVSCAYARPVKRLHLIAEALAHVDFPITWTHIGGGPELPRVQNLCQALPTHVEVVLLGSLLPEEVSNVYAQNPFDLFLNVSESEGIPVSIMEAMAAGIPALATDVGGNAEIVDDSVGGLVEADISPAMLAEAIAKLGKMTAWQRHAMRQACRQRIERDYDQSRNAKAVAEALLHLNTVRV